MKKVVLLICFALFTSQLFAQEKPQAVKFEEYSEKDGVNLSLLAEKTKRFAQKLRKMPKASRGIIFVFSSWKEKKCFFDNKYTSEDRFDYIYNLLAKDKKIFTRISFEPTSTYRNNTEIEFWILPENTEKPYADGAIVHCYCPSFGVVGVEVSDDKNEPLVFAAYLGTWFSGQTPVYEWKISAGNIIDGRGKSAITVDTTGVQDKEITATLTLKGLPRNLVELCGNYYDSFTTKIQSK